MNFIKNSRPKWLIWIDALTEVDETVRDIIKAQFKARRGPPKNRHDHPNTIPTPELIPLLGAAAGIDMDETMADMDEMAANIDQPSGVDDGTAADGDQSSDTSDGEGLIEESFSDELIHENKNLRKRLFDAEADIDNLTKYAIQLKRESNIAMDEKDNKIQRICEDYDAKMTSLETTIETLHTKIESAIEAATREHDKMKTELSLAQAGILTTPTLVCDPRLAIKFPPAWTASDVQVAFEQIASYTTAYNNTTKLTITNLQTENRSLRLHCHDMSHYPDVPFAQIPLKPPFPTYSPTASPRTNKCAIFVGNFLMDTDN